MLIAHFHPPEDWGVLFIAQDGNTIWTKREINEANPDADDGDMQVVVFKSAEDCREACARFRPDRPTFEPREVDFAFVARVAATHGFQKIVQYSSELQPMFIWPLHRGDEALQMLTGS